VDDLSEILKNYPPELIETNLLGTTSYNLPLNDRHAMHRILAAMMKHNSEVTTKNSVGMVPLEPQKDTEEIPREPLMINGVMVTLPKISRG
jgi:hypothetical protein